MSRWIRGRLGRPITSIVSILMLVSILLPLAPPPVHAQGADVIDWSALVDGVKDKSTPIAVVDFYNRSQYPTGDLGRNMARMMSLALETTGKFATVSAQQVESAMVERGLSVPMDFSAQALLADRLNVPFIVSGEIEDVKIHEGRDGAYAEVVVNAIVVSRMTRLPINGARVVQKSSPKLDVINKNSLVKEALDTASYQIAQRIIDNRVPVATVLLADQSGNIRLRGGAMTGLKVGMELVAVRQQSVSGILRVVQVGSADAQCVIVENFRGIAPADRAVPIYSLEAPAKTIEARRGLTRNLGAILGLGLLAALVGNSQGADDAPATVTATPLADAALFNGIYDTGGNLIRWRNTGKNVVKWIIYRHYDGMDMPIGVVPASQNYFIDYESEIDSEMRGEGEDAKLYFIGYRREYLFSIREFATSLTIADDSYGYVTYDWLATDTMPIELTSGEVSIGRALVDDEVEEGTIPGRVYAPLYPSAIPGGRYAYRVRSVYAEYYSGTISGGGDEAGEEQGDRWDLKLGELSDITDMVVLTEVPTIVTPGPTDPMTGTFEMERVPVANKYILQVSSDMRFADRYTETVIAQQVAGEPNIISAQFTMNQIRDSAKLRNATRVYVRMGARAEDSPVPTSLNASYYNGYVFSDVREFPVSQTMLMFNSLNTSLTNKSIRGVGVREESKSRRRLQRR